MKKKIILALAAVASFLSISVYGSYAYLTAEIKTENVITAGNLKIALIETSSAEDGFGAAVAGRLNGVMPGKTISKIVQVENRGDNEAYVRVQVKKDIILAEGNSSPDLSLVTCDFNKEYWIDGNDGYYYYRDSLEAGRRTEPLFEKVAFDASMGNLYQDSRIRMEIKAQATQVANNGESVMEAKGWPEDGE